MFALPKRVRTPFHMIILTTIAVTVISAAQAADGWSGSSAPAATPQTDVAWYGETGIDLTLHAPLPEITLHKTAGGTFAAANWPGVALGGEVGAPAVPVVRRLFVAPVGATITVESTGLVSETLALADRAINVPLIPYQPAISQADGPLEDAPFYYDEAAYQRVRKSDGPQVTVVPAGICRGHQLYCLEVRPVAYDAGSNALTVWNEIDISISIDGGQPTTVDLGPFDGLRTRLLNPPTPVQDRGLDLLIVMADDFDGTTAMDDFVSLKQSEGFAVMQYVATSGTTATQIRTYIASVYNSANRPDFVVLVGDSDTIPAWTGGGDSSAATDLPYVCMDAGDDWYPDMVVGRISVRTVAGLGDIVDKYLSIDAREFALPSNPNYNPDFVKNAALLATNDTSSGGEETHNEAIETYLDPAGFTSTRIYATQGGGTSDITAAVNNGSLITVYFGHSSSSGWWTPSFEQSDIEALANSTLYGLVFGFSCNTAHFTYDECSGETWLREADKGAAAYLSASTYIYYTSPPWHEASCLELGYFKALIQAGERKIGTAWYMALADLLATYGPSDPVTRDYYEMFVILGDPSWTLPQEDGFVISSTPQLQEACVPAVNQVDYTLEVVSTGLFHEAVTLAVANLPAGATAVFSSNDQTPPYTSTLTIGNLTGVVPDLYTLEVKGSSSLFNRTVNFDLSVSDGVPTAPTLTSPPNGEADVSRWPTLVWQEATGGVEYYVEVATDAAFSNVVFSAAVTGTSVDVDTQLNRITEHYWRVIASNGCGDGAYSSAFTFTTIDQADYFTEDFGSGGSFDLEGITLTFTPDGSGDFYSCCAVGASAYPTNPTGHTALDMRDDNYEAVVLSESRTVALYNYSYTTFYVGSNGFITFGSGDSDWDETLAEHFSVPRISAMYNDLSPNVDGTCTWAQLEDRAVVTFDDVPEFNTTNSNSFQYELFFDGTIRVTWLSMAASDGIVGLSRGDGIPSDYLDSDLSQYAACPEECPSDLTGDGVVNLADLQMLLAAYGSQPGDANWNATADFDGNDVIDLSDLQQLLSDYGTNC